MSSVRERKKDEPLLTIGELKKRLDESGDDWECELTRDGISLFGPVVKGKQGSSRYLGFIPIPITGGILLDQRIVISL